jgi:uncharacterized protein YidB (DUF937 family)
MSSANMFGSNQNPAVPGGSVAKPLIIALLALLAARSFGGKGGDAPAKPTAAPAPQPQSQPNALPDPGSILDGLGGLIKQFQQKGLGDAINSWVNTGTNKDISSGQVSEALPRDVVDELARRTGLSRDQVVGAGRAAAHAARIGAVARLERDLGPVGTGFGPDHAQQRVKRQR